MTAISIVIITAREPTAAMPLTKPSVLIKLKATATAARMAIDNEREIIVAANFGASFSNFFNDETSKIIIAAKPATANSPFTRFSTDIPPKSLITKAMIPIAADIAIRVDPTFAIASPLPILLISKRRVMTARKPPITAAPLTNSSTVKKEINLTAATISIRDADSDSIVEPRFLRPLSKMVDIADNAVIIPTKYAIATAPFPSSAPSIVPIIFIA